MVHLIINAALFQLAWFCLVVGEVLIGAICVASMLAHVLWRMKCNFRVLVFLIFVVSVGVIGDTALSILSVYDFNNTEHDLPFTPIWLVLLWLAFALTLNHALDWLVNDLKFSLVLFAVFGPASYWLGSQLNSEALSVSLMYIPLAVLQWGFMAWLIFWLKQQLQLSISDYGDEYEDN